MKAFVANVKALADPPDKGWLPWRRTPVWEHLKAPAPHLYHLETPTGTEFVECARLPQPPVVTKPRLYYDPVTESFEIMDGEPSANPTGALPTFLHLLVGSVVAVSLFRNMMKLYRVGARKSIRLFLSEMVYSTTLKSTPYQLVRKVFLDASSFSTKPSANHSHPDAASARSTAVTFFRHVATQLGLDVYCYQMSSRDQSDHARGERTYYWARDANVMPWLDDIRDTDAVTMVDVDYYVDMPTHLAEHPQTHMLYTFVPETAGRTTPEYSYFFNANSELVLSVAGGAKYIHKLWNWCNDWFTVHKYYYGIPVETVLYDCTVRDISPDKAAVLLVPCKRWTGLSSILVWLIGRPLERLTTAVGGGFTKVRRRSEGQVKVSVARQCTETSATVELDTFNRLRALQHISPNNKLLPYQVKQLVHANDAAIVTDYFCHATDEQVPDLHVVPEPRMVEFSFGAPEPEDKPAMVAFAQPLVPPAFVPTNNPKTANQAIQGRVRIPAETVKKLLGDFKMTKHKIDVVHQFVTRLIPEAGCLTPLDYNGIMERQRKPSQVRDMLDAGFLNKCKGVVQSFMKKEAYGKPTDPRNITTYPPNVKADYAAFMYPLMDYMKTMQFYAFGKTPKEVAQNVARVAQRAKDRLNCPDLHRMDGFVNEFCRIIERSVGLRAFGPEHAAAFQEAHDQAFGNTGYTADSEEYDQGFSRGSGSLETSVFNSIINAFIIFYAFVLSGRSYDDAWSDLCEEAMVGGDDGLVATIAPGHLIRAAQFTGFVLTCDTFLPGQAGVNFLARVYGPDVWHGDPNSMCQLKRTLEKIHLTPNVPLSNEQKMYEKALSYSLTDLNTPIVGAFCKAVLRVCNGFTTTGTVVRYGDHHAPADQYPNTAEEWMWQFVEEELTLLDVSALDDYLTCAGSIEQLLNIPKFYVSGREFTYEDWDPTPGRLIKQTLEVLGDKPRPTSKRSKQDMQAAVQEGAAAVLAAGVTEEGAREGTVATPEATPARA